MKQIIAISFLWGVLVGGITVNYMCGWMMNKQAVVAQQEINEIRMALDLMYGETYFSEVAE